LVPTRIDSSAQNRRHPAASVPVEGRVASDLSEASELSKNCIVAVLLCPGCCGETRAGALVGDGVGESAHQAALSREAAASVAVASTASAGGGLGLFLLPGGRPRFLGGVLTGDTIAT
jgi:hypothetical protein